MVTLAHTVHARPLVLRVCTRRPWPYFLSWYVCLQLHFLIGISVSVVVNDWLVFAALVYYTAPIEIFVRLYISALAQHLN